MRWETCGGIPTVHPEQAGALSGVTATLGLALDFLPTLVTQHPLELEHPWFFTPHLSLQDEIGGRTTPQVRSPTCRDPKVGVHAPCICFQLPPTVVWDGAHCSSFLTAVSVMEVMDISPNLSGV